MHSHLDLKKSHFDPRNQVPDVMREAEINDAITKLYENVETYSAEDHWYFEIFHLPFDYASCYIPGDAGL